MKVFTPAPVFQVGEAQITEPCCPEIVAFLKSKSIKPIVTGRIEGYPERYHYGLAIEDTHSIRMKYCPYCGEQIESFGATGFKKKEEETKEYES